MKILTTFPGKNGDILWSLPTVRQISKNHDVKVDFGIMPQYHTLLPLLDEQSYIAKAFLIDDWLCTGSPHGDQPWEPQGINRLIMEYDKVYNLGYRYHPGIHGPQMPLLDFVAYLQGIELTYPVIPFITVEENLRVKGSLAIVSYSFNTEYKDLKDRFLHHVTTHCPNVVFIDVTSMPWETAGTVIKHSEGFMGCCSSNHVLAYGVGQQHIFIYEPHPNRHALGHFGGTFNCPYIKIATHPMEASPEQSADIAIENINNWVKVYQ